MEKEFEIQNWNLKIEIGIQSLNDWERHWPLFFMKCAVDHSNWEEDSAIIYWLITKQLPLPISLWNGARKILQISTAHLKEICNWIEVIFEVIQDGVGSHTNWGDVWII